MRQEQVHLPDGAASGAGGEDAATVEARVVEAEARAAQAVARYRETVAAGSNLIAEMVQGSTLEEIDASAEAARQAYAELSRRIALQQEREVPAGNPARSGSIAGTETLKPEAKIALGLRTRS